MGIYSNGIVYGVCWSINDLSYNVIKLFERTYETKLNIQQIQEIKVEYDKLSDTQRANVHIQFYTCCSSSYDAENVSTFMSWFPGSTEAIEELFLKGDIPI